MGAAVDTVAPAAEREKPPDTRGGTAPLPVSVFVAGIAAIASILLGSLAVQLYFAAYGGPITEECELTLINTATGNPIRGAEGVCHMYQAFLSPGQTFFIWLAVALGAASLAAGILTFRRMPSKRMREQCIAGAALGGQAIVLAIALTLFRSGELMIFIRTFLNFDQLDGYYVRFVTVGARNTLLLALVGELGGIAIGLIFAVLNISNRRVIRAPAVTYINFFRGTPLIWQLVFFHSMFRLGFQWDIEPFESALIIFAANTGAYAAEVFRAGIQSIERGQMEAARSLGMSYLQAMRYAIVPQAVRRVIPPLMNEFVILIKDTALIAVLGLTIAEYDILVTARDGFSRTANGTFFIAAAAGYLIITLPLIRIVTNVEKRLRSGLTGVVGGQ